MSLNPLGQKLRVGLFRFTIVPRQPLLVPAVNKGNMLRGGFGHAFRKLCCIPQCPGVAALPPRGRKPQDHRGYNELDAREGQVCPLQTTCPYKLIFEPSPPPGSERLSKNQDIPRPFVFRPPLTEQTRFQKDEPFEFELVLIGKALDFLPYFVLSFRELADQGLGLNRARCTLERVVELGPPAANAAPMAKAAGATETAAAPSAAVSAGRPVYESKAKPGWESPAKLIYDSKDQLFRPPQGMTASEWIEARLRNLCPDGSGNVSGSEPAAAELPRQITIRFLTPTLLRANGEIIREPEFHHIFKRARDRVSALCSFFGDGPLDVDFYGLGERAEVVQTISANFTWAERHRTSSRTHQRHELSGFTGTGMCEGDLAEFLPWLTLGELVGLGKHTPWGNGWMEVFR